jgi:hypothetical protein
MVPEVVPVVPLAGDTESQVPLLVAADVVKLIGPGEPDTVTFCVTAVVLPTGTVKTNGVVGAEMLPELTWRVIGTTSGLPFAKVDVTITLPW